MMSFFSFKTLLFSFYSVIEHKKSATEYCKMEYFPQLCIRKVINDMGKKQMSLEELRDSELVKVDYSDDDVVIIDNIRKLVEVDTTRIRMNIIAVAKRGKAEFNIGEQRLTFGENQLLICPPNTVFTDFMFSPDFEFKAFFFTNRIIQSFLREKMNIWNETMYVYKRHVVTLKPRDIRYLFSLYNMLQICIDAPAEEYIYRTECIQGVLGAGVLGLCGKLKVTMPEKKEIKHTSGDNIFQQFLDLVNSNKSKAHTVEDFASELCISPKYLSVVCKKASGKTANEWLREHMLEEIRYYIRQTDLPVKQIAYKLGFANPSFFGKYVKEHFGKTPLQLRHK